MIRIDQSINELTNQRVSSQTNINSHLMKNVGFTFSHCEVAVKEERRHHLDKRAGRRKLSKLYRIQEHLEMIDTYFVDRKS